MPREAALSHDWQMMDLPTAEATEVLWFEPDGSEPVAWKMWLRQDSSNLSLGETLAPRPDR